MSGSQILENFFLFTLMALVLEVSVSALFSIKVIDELLKNSLTKAIKNILVLMLAFFLVIKIPQLKILAGTKIKLDKVLHITLSALVLARLANVFHDWFQYLKRKNSN